MSSDGYQWNYDYNRLVRDLGFSFKTYQSNADVNNNIANVDIDRIIKETDISTLEQHTNTVIDFILDNDQTSILDPSSVKIFHISQLLVQYLLFCKKYLDNSIAIIKKEVFRKNEEIKNLKCYGDEMRQEVLRYKKQVKELKSALNCQIANIQNGPVFQCDQCPKAFSTDDYLTAHIKRRHEPLHHVTSFQAETNKLQLEIKELKERLNNTEKYTQNNEPGGIRAVSNLSQINEIQNTTLMDLQQKFEWLKVHVDNELKILQTQKFDQEKYEKWFDGFLNKMEYLHFGVSSQQSVVCEKCRGKTVLMEDRATNVKAEVTECATQTDVVVTVCKHCQTDKLAQNFEKKDAWQQFNSEINQGPSKFDEIVEEEVSDSLELIENKTTNLEEQQQLRKVELDESFLKPEPPKVVPKPRTRVFHNKELPQPIKVVKSNQSTPRNSELKQEEKVTPKLIPSPIPSQNTRDNSDSESTESATSESSDSETDTDLVKKRVMTKPSTTSTLGQRSLTSLKEAAFTPEVLGGLRIELENMLNVRLQNLGVSPEWTTLPARSYHCALEIVNHQASLTKKNITNYLQIRSNILKDLDKAVPGQKKLTVPSQKKLKLRIASLNFRQKSKAEEPKLSNKEKNSRKHRTKTKMYVTDSDSDSVSKRATTWNKSIIADEAQKAYFDVIQELNTTVTAKIKSRENSLSDVPSEIPRRNVGDAVVKVEQAQAKGVLKNYPSTGSLQKKKVLFNLDEEIENKVANDGSTTSIASSVFDGLDNVKANFVAKAPEKKQELSDVSDWDLSLQ